MEGFDDMGKGTGKNLFSVEQVSSDQDKVHPFSDGISHDVGQSPKEVFVGFVLSGGGAVSLAEVEVSGVKEFILHIFSMNGLYRFFLEFLSEQNYKIVK